MDQVEEAKWELPQAGRYLRNWYKSE